MKRFFRFYKNRYQISTKKNMFSNKLFMKPLKHIKTVGKKWGRKKCLECPLRENSGQKRKNAKND